MREREEKDRKVQRPAMFPVAEDKSCSKLSLQSRAVGFGGSGEPRGEDDTGTRLFCIMK